MKKYKETFEIEGDVSLAPTTVDGGRAGDASGCLLHGVVMSRGVYPTRGKHLR